MKKEKLLQHIKSLTEDRIKILEQRAKYNKDPEEIDFANQVSQIAKALRIDIEPYQFWTIMYIVKVVRVLNKMEADDGTLKDSLQDSQNYQDLAYLQWKDDRK